MHSPQDEPARDTLDEACDMVLTAFVDSFATPLKMDELSDEWLTRVIKALEETRLELINSANCAKSASYSRNLSRCVYRLERTLGALYDLRMLY